MQTCEGVMCDFNLLCCPEIMNKNVKEGSMVVGYTLFRVEILETRKIEYEANQESES